MAVGGQGNLLASKVLGEAALANNVPMHMSEIHGMAQRGGVVESTIVFGDAQSTIISDGEADVLVGFEPLETLRALNKCNRDTVVITNTTISGNDADYAGGIGSYTAAAETGVVVLRNSTIANNLARAGGGGLYGYLQTDEFVLYDTIVAIKQSRE